MGKKVSYVDIKPKEFKKDELPPQFEKGYVAIVIAGTYFTKKFPVHKISEICQKISFPVILLGGKDEFDFVDFCHAKATNPEVFEWLEQPGKYV